MPDGQSITRPHATEGGTDLPRRAASHPSANCNKKRVRRSKMSKAHPHVGRLAALKLAFVALAAVALCFSLGGARAGVGGKTGDRRRAESAKTEDKKAKADDKKK